MGALAGFFTHPALFIGGLIAVLSPIIIHLLNKQIAVRLGVTEATIKVHRGRVMEKTGVESVAQRVRLYERAAALR